MRQFWIAPFLGLCFAAAAPLAQAERAGRAPLLADSASCPAAPEHQGAVDLLIGRVQAAPDEASAQQDSFSRTGLLDCPHYTRPEVWQGKGVPKVLRSGDHNEIRQWRLQQSLLRTKIRRPDLFAQLELNSEEIELLKRLDLGG